MILLNLLLKVKIISLWDFSLRIILFWLIKKWSKMPESRGNPSEKLKFNTRNINLNSTPRDHMLEVINIHDKNNGISKQDKNKNLGSYLAGLIEGDGAIHIPKNIKSASMITISFHSKDLPIILIIQKTLNIGNVYKIKGKNAYSYTISDLKGLTKIVHLINGYMRTPKIIQLYKLIDRMSIKESSISKLPLDYSPLDSNAWLSGFIDAEGCFTIRVTQNKHCSTKKIALMLALVEKTINLNNESLLDIMTQISKFLLCNLKTVVRAKQHAQYSARTANLQGNLAVKDYLNKYPLFTSKYLDYLAWEKVLTMIINKQHRQNAEAILKLKQTTNSRRTHFNWNHLNNFYNYFD